MEQDTDLLERVKELEVNHSILQSNTKDVEKGLQQAQMLSDIIQSEQKNVSKQFNDFSEEFLKTATCLVEANDRFEGKLLIVESEMLIINQKLDGILDRLDRYLDEENDSEETFDD